MLSSPYIYVTGSHLDQLCAPHYLPCKTMFICLYVGKYDIKKNPLYLVFKIDFENLTSEKVFFKENPFQISKKDIKYVLKIFHQFLRMSNI